MTAKSPSRRDFIKNTGLSVGITSFVLPVVAGCGDDATDPFEPVLEWESKASALEKGANCCWTESNPSDREGASAEAHAPVVEMTDDGDLMVYLAAGHPMVADHWITSMYVKDQRGVVIWYVSFGEERILPSQAATGRQWTSDNPAILIRPPAGTTQVKAYAYCNLHQNWTSPVTDI